MRKIAESTVRRLSLYLRFLEEFEAAGVATVSSEALARRGSTTSMWRYGPSGCSLSARAISECVSQPAWPASRAQRA